MSGGQGAQPVGAAVANLRELRFAPILTGGTSLAVWIGGVSAELYRLVNCRADPRPEDSLYRDLLDVTCTNAVIDVVTGTSAGGLNGVLLATAWTRGVPTRQVVGLRDVWMQLGSINSLLRSPNELDPPSLLRGDEYFWPQLTSVLERLAGGGAPAGPPTRDCDLALTVTTLSGEPTYRIDDIGQRLQETRQDHLLRFVSPGWSASGTTNSPDQVAPTAADFDTSDAQWARRLALAARTSASIPGVFEASYLPVVDRVAGRPAFAGRATFELGRWAVDGGVLANQPIGAALGRIVERSARGDLRRVALFVNPTPGSPGEVAEDDPAEPPPLRDVIASAFTAPRNIGIRSQIDALRSHNERVRRAVDVRLAIAKLVSPTDPVERHAARAYDRFTEDRTAQSVATMLDRLASQVADADFDRRAVEEALVAAARASGWLPAALPDTVGPDWSWGIASIDYAASMLLDVVRRCFQLPPALVGVEEARRLGELRAGVHHANERLREVRDRDSRFWVAALINRDAEHLAQWAATCYAAWPDSELLLAGPDEVAAESEDPQRYPSLTAVTKEWLWEIALELACYALELLDVYGELARRVGSAGDELLASVEAEDEWEAVTLLAGLLTVEQGLGISARSRGEPALEAALEATVLRLVALHVLAVALGDTARRPVPIEFIEVSWNAPNQLDPRKPAEKLAGTEMSRLGAFVKPSWRANDWMWGRMDGAAQLVGVLLDPRRLRQLGVSAEAVIELAGRHVTLSAAEISALNVELGFLHPLAGEVPLPRSLPVAVAAFARRLQLDIAREELPHVYEAVQLSIDEGAAEGDGGTFRRSYTELVGAKGAVAPGDDAIAELLRTCRIGSEAAAIEVGEDMLTRVTGRAVVVAANMLTGTRSGLSWPARIARPFRQVALVSYAVTRSMTTSSRTGIAFSVALLAIAGAVLGMDVLGSDINPGLVLGALAVLGAGLFVALVRSGVWAGLPALAALLVVGLALLGGDVREVVTTSPDTDWKQTLFLGDVPAALLVVAAALFVWLVSLGDRASRTLRARRRESRRRALTGAERPALPLAVVVEVCSATVLVPAAVLLHRPFFRFVLEGSRDERWRELLIRSGEWLGARSVLAVLAGLVGLGAFLGVGWDRALRAPLLRIVRRSRLRGAR